MIIAAYKMHVCFVRKANPNIIAFIELKAVERKNNTPFTVPWWGVVIGYILCGVCIVNGVWWPYIYGIDWGKEVALEWLASLVVSVLQSIIVTQPVKVRGIFHQISDGICILCNEDSGSNIHLC